jgi:3-methyl-2-oxobutanoate hydroxymethyltransferase
MAVTLSTLKAMRGKGEKIAVLTCYDASFARVLDAAGVDVLLVGDSLGMVVQGHASTLPVKLAEMSYHTRCVAAGTERAFIVADLPFGSYQPSPERAFAASARLMAAGAHMVKLEGGAVMVETVAFLTQRGIPVCAHVGLLPQSVNQLGGYRVQGREDAAAAQLIADARALEAAGAGLIVLEMVPAALAQAVTAALADSHHRHRRRRRLFRPGAGAVRHAGPVSARAEILEELPGRRRRHRGRRARLCRRGEGRQLPAAEHAF